MFSKRITISRVDARDCRDQLLDLCARNRFEMHEKLFDWYYGENRRGHIVSWVARLDAGRIIGFCSVVPRTFSIEGTLVRVGVLGNLLVDAQHRNTLAGLNLLRASQEPIRERQIDILLGTPNKGPAQKLVFRAGFRLIDQWQTFVLVFRSYRMLRQRYGWLGAIASPALDVTAVARRLRSDFCDQTSAGFRISGLTDGLDDGERKSWNDAEKCLALHADSSDLRQRFDSAPHKEYRVLGIRDETRLCGYLVTHVKRGQTEICECATDPRLLSPAQAILRLCREREFRKSMISVTTLRNSRLAQCLQKCGFAHVPARFGGCDLALVGAWRPDDPLSDYFKDPRCWNIFPGSNDV